VSFADYIFYTRSLALARAILFSNLRLLNPQLLQAFIYQEKKREMNLTIIDDKFLHFIREEKREKKNRRIY